MTSDLPQDQFVCKSSEELEGCGGGGGGGVGGQRTGARNNNNVFGVRASVPKSPPAPPPSADPAETLMELI